MGVIAGQAGQADDGVAMDPDQACGGADATSFLEMAEDRHNRLVGELGPEEDGPFVLREGVLADVAAEESVLAMLAEAVVNREVSGVASAEFRTLGIGTAETREIVHRHEASWVKNRSRLAYPRMGRGAMLRQSIFPRTPPEILLDKYFTYRPTERLLASWRLLGLNLAAGTVTDGLQRLEVLLRPIYEAIKQRNPRGDLHQGDETRWRIFVLLEGKEGYGWWLWMVKGPDTVIYLLEPSRGHTVVENHFGTQSRGVLVVDRYAAYKAMIWVKDGVIVLAFCWSHVRRDFIRVGKGGLVKTLNFPDYPAFRGGPRYPPREAETSRFWSHSG